MVIKANNDLSKSFFREARERASAEQAMTFLEKLRKQPIFSYGVFAIVLVLAQLLSKIGLLYLFFFSCINILHNSEK